MSAFDKWFMQKGKEALKENAKMALRQAWCAGAGYMIDYINDCSKCDDGIKKGEN